MATLYNSMYSATSRWTRYDSSTQVVCLSYSEAAFWITLMCLNSRRDSLLDKWMFSPRPIMKHMYFFNLGITLESWHNNDIIYTLSTCFYLNITALCLHHSEGKESDNIKPAQHLVCQVMNKIQNPVLCLTYKVKLIRKRFIHIVLKSLLYSLWFLCYRMCCSLIPGGEEFFASVWDYADPESQGIWVATDL